MYLLGILSIFLFGFVLGGLCLRRWPSRDVRKQQDYHRGYLDGYCNGVATKLPSEEVA